MKLREQVQKAPAELVARKRKIYRSATSGVKVGSRTVVAESAADEVLGRRMTVHCQATAVCGLVSS